MSGTMPVVPIAIVGVSAIMPEAPDAETFWTNLKSGRYSITDVPPERWDPELYYDPDPHAPDKTYSRIGGWVREFPWDPIGWKLPIPPKVAEQMDGGQRWALSCARSALTDAGWPNWDVDPERVAVILGNAIGGEKHYASNLRIEMPEVLRGLHASPTFAALPEQARAAILEETRKEFYASTFEITEDTMPGELANVMAGRIANLFDFRGPNFTTDAACASGLAAIWSASQGLASHQYDVALTGGVDRNMGVAAFVKFCKIGALSATGTRPFDAGADGFVMGEGAALFVLKRLEDAERVGDRIYAVLLGIAGSSDGKGKGITAPNPKGQRIAIERAWQQAGIDPATASALEAHGTSTRVGDASELESLTSVFGPAGAKPGSVALGSVKSNIGHLKAAAGAAGLFKLTMSLHNKVLVPSLHFGDPNPNVDWATSPFKVNTELRDWPTPESGVRRGAVSAFGFGGTNFHAVLEEYVPGRSDTQPKTFAAAEVPAREPQVVEPAPAAAPPRAIVVLAGGSDDEVVAQLRQVHADAAAGTTPPPFERDPALAHAAVRVAIDYGDATELAAKAEKLLKAFETGNAALFRMLRSQGVFIGRGPAPKVAFLYTGQGSQYVNMLKDLRASEPIVAQTFDEADAIMTPLLGRPLSSYIFIDAGDPAAVALLEQQLLQTEITQPAVLTSDLALTRLLADHHVRPDMVMGHSLGEYGALVAAGALDFHSALEAVSARGHEMASLTVEDNGAMAAVFGPLPEIERIVAEADGYVVVANVNSNSQAVVGGATAAVEKIIETFQAAGITAARIPVSHAFHTSIVAPASEPLKVALRRLNVRAPQLPIVANVTGEFYPEHADVETMLDILGKQVASPVQFVKGLHTLYAAGVRVYVEVGPKKALHGFVEDVLGSEHDDVLALFTNHPKFGDAISFNQALCGLYAAGLGLNGSTPVVEAPAIADVEVETPEPVRVDGWLPVVRPVTDAPVVITGAAVGLPGVPRVFDDENVGRLLSGQQFIESIPQKIREEMVDKHITRLVKPENGDPTFVPIDDVADVIKLAGRHAPIDLVAEFGVEEARDAALDEVTRLAIGAGIDALRDAGIPLVMHYRTTTLGTQLPDRWELPESLQDDTGVIFASAFPGFTSFAHDLRRYGEDRARRHELATLQAVRDKLAADSSAAADVDARITELERQLADDPFTFDRRFLFRVLSMGHSQFAELIGARGPNTQVNSACASTTVAMCIAEDWIRAGRCRRVVVVAADDVTSDELLPWVSSGFLASGAAATDENVADAAIPFDRRRHGMIIGTGAAAIVVESADAAAERGIRPICEIVAAVAANSAFHGTRLDLQHVSQTMEQLLRRAEARGIDRQAIAPNTLFVSHETYTPARGGSASAEINALRSTFGAAADEIVIANTKGYTGHAMGAGVEDILAIKSLETGIVPPVPNFREADPELGSLNLSKGGEYPVEYALRLAAGFGSQIAMAVLRRTPGPVAGRPAPDRLGFRYRIADPAVWRAWLAAVSGRPDPELEVVQHRLRVVDGKPAVAPEPEPESVQLNTPDVPAAVVTIVSELTGYPPELLDPELDLEADLGVDTVKQAEVFASVRAKFGIERDETLKLRDFPTLNHVIGWIESKIDTTPAAAPEPTSAPEQQPEPASVQLNTPDVRAAVVAIVSELTGYPTELLDPELDLEADLGVDTVKQAEVFASVRAKFDIERDETLKLRDFPTLNHVIGWIESKLDTTPAAAPVVATAVEEPKVEQVAVSSDAVREAVVAIVAELTGYPTELLDPELDLEADLGVDTVKQAEVFASVRAKFDIERDETLKLRDFPTLNHVIGWIESKLDTTPAAAPVVATVVEEPKVEQAAVSSDAVREAVVAIVAELTGYPTELLDPELDLEADLGVDTVKQAEVFASVRAKFDIERDETLKLRDFPTLNHVIGWIESKLDTTPEPTSAPEQQPEPASVQLNTPDVRAAVVEIVAELTGYPTELLDPDLDLEADLGVDTVKQAEVFASVRAKFGIERDETLKLRDFPTLNHVIGWIESKIAAKAEVGPAAAQHADEVAVERPTAPTPTVASDVNDECFPRRVPTPVLRAPAANWPHTNVTLDEGARVVVMLDEGGVGTALQARLAERNVTTLTLNAGIGTADLQDKVAEWLADGPITGVFWLPALDDEGPADKLDLATWRRALRRRVKNLYATMRASYEHAPFLVSATRLGGYFGYDEAGATAPLGGAVSGFTKAYHRELPDALVKVVDVPLEFPADRLADALVTEAEHDAGCVEVGHGLDGTRWTIALTEQPFGDTSTGLRLGADSVFVVTGAAGSIVSAITADLATASGGTFHLLDLTPKPDPEDPDLARFSTDKDGLKSELATRLKDAGERPTPVLIEKELARIERLAAALAAVRAIESAGGTAHYHQVDLTDADAVTAVVDAVRATSGHVDVLLHAAGLEISKTLPAKEAREYDLVFDVKTEGWFNLLHAAAELPIGATVVFSSVAGRFGNAGQTDYSAANDLLCKLTSNLRRTRPTIRGSAIDWTAWGGIGMATRGSIPKIMEMAGVEMLDPAVGVPWIRHELTAARTPGEVVVAGALGLLGAQPDSLPLTTTEPAPMIGAVTGEHGGLIVRTTLDPKEQPFLNDHRIDGIAVLPGVMGIEGFAEAARLFVPDWHVAGVEDVDFHAPLKFYRDEPRELVIRASARRDGTDVLVRCVLEAERVLAGSTEPQRTTHFTGTVRLSATAPQPEQDTAVVEPAETVGREQVYALYFHGPAYQVVAASWTDSDTAVGRFAADLPLNHTGNADVTAQPRLIELCFQTAGLWEAARNGRLALPLRVDKVRLVQRIPGGPLFAIARERDGGFDCTVQDATGHVVLRVDGYRTVALPGAVPDDIRRGLNPGLPQLSNA